MTNGPIPSLPSRWLPGRWILLALALSVGGGAAAEETLDLAFRPPEVNLGQICVSPPSDDETTDFWGHWDGRVLPDRPLRSIRRDINRLTAIDGVRWFDTTARAMELLEATDPAFEGQVALMMRIAALDAAGKFEELSESGLVVALAMQAGELQPSAKLVLSRYLRDGIGIAPDPVSADRLLTEAGFLGEPKALLTLAALQLAQKAPAGWTVPVELTVTTAFSNMVGEPDMAICSRAERIATAFRQGRVVTANRQLAHDWYRFSADLGSGHAAWLVVEYHMRAEGFDKSNDLLVRYLEKAASADLSYAQIELGRVVERGALAPRDIDRAHSLYQAASRSGDLRGLSQFALFLRRHETTHAGFREQRIAVLNALILRNDAPGWAFSQLAEVVLEDQGRWAGAGEARLLLEQAVARGNLDGHVLLARLILAHDPDAGQIDHAVDLLAHVVEERGGAQPMILLLGALVCSGQGAPDRAAAQYWTDRKLAIGVSDFSGPERPLSDLRIATDGTRLAEVQSFALSGSPDSLAMWRRIIETAPFADDAMRRFWADYFEQTDARLVAQASLDLSLTHDLEVRDLIFAALRERHLESGPEFAGLLSQSLINGMYEPAKLAQTGARAQDAAADILARSSAYGYGVAMVALARLAADPVEKRAVFDRFRPVIDAYGDYAAQVFAAHHADTPAFYVTRAAGIMPCNFDAAMKMAALNEELGDDAGVARWLDVADVFAVERTYSMIALARFYLRSGKAEYAPRALELLSLASAQGDTRADAVIFRLIATPGTPVFDPDRAAGMIAKALESEQFTVLASYLSVHRKADPMVRTQIARQLDMPMIYRRAAESGGTVAMRIHGLALREQAASSADLALALDWLSRAAQAGDTIAMFEFGQALAFGIGVPTDRAQALFWLERAAAQGNNQALEITRLIELSGAAGQ